MFRGSCSLPGSQASENGPGTDVRRHHSSSLCKCQGHSTLPTLLWESLQEVPVSRRVGSCTGIQTEPTQRQSSRQNHEGLKPGGRVPAEIHPRCGLRPLFLSNGAEPMAGTRLFNSHFCLTTANPMHLAHVSHPFQVWASLALSSLSLWPCWPGGAALLTQAALPGGNCPCSDSLRTFLSWSPGEAEAWLPIEVKAGLSRA